ncbi:cytochrome-c peroxidase [Massilia psychrophila]|uniref:Uncharacterized protein n=1 Tax=Massilia psychrophila TaxID=1603353 RepID=A0A2G8SZ32_9BURK|nr:cytochrome c peroxidase [Massilia psychrophila]PIL38708.1 hypothetical protein CR103_16335 [Massilia psychrophila]
MLTSKSFRTSYIMIAIMTIYFSLSFGIVAGQAQDTSSPDLLRAKALNMGINSLKTVKVADAPTFKQFVVDRTKLQQLGKALFWDQQVGSDGQSCASCHFHAGADNRSKNQVNPGFRSSLIAGGDTVFGQTSRGKLTPNYQLTLDDFPFHKLQDPNNRNSLVLSDTNDVVSSQGSFNVDFRGFGLSANDIGIPVAGVFKDPATGAMVRNVEPRNTPTVINAALNHRNFWDGRGRNEFNGVNPLGSLDAEKIVKITSVNSVVFVQTRISNSSGASQAVGPPLSALEMSFSGRTFPLIGRKLLNRTPLAGQNVALNDSVLGSGLTTGEGLKVKYVDLVRGAFDPTWWNAPLGWVVDLADQANPELVKLPDGAKPSSTQFTVMEYNFGLFMGMAVNEYEKLLIANDSRFDQFMEGDNSRLSPQEQQGLRIYLGSGKCINCHGGAEMTNASLRRVQGFEVLERMIMGNDRVAVYDNGFYNIGVRPTKEDMGVGATIGSKNRPLSNSRAFQKCVNDALTANPSLSLAQANDSCGVPRMLARPAEAAKLLAKAAAQVGNPQQAIILLNQANALISSAPPDLVQGSCKLAKNPALPCPVLPDGSGVQMDGALDVLAKFSIDPAVLTAAASLLPDPVSPGAASSLLAPPLGRNERVAVDGAFKTPTARNVELTAPYFHNGGTATLDQLVDFYNRGGDFAVQNQDNLDPDIQPLGLSIQDKADLVAFLRALTDERVRFDKAPFDHPSLNLPNGGSAASYNPAYSFGAGSPVPIMDDRVTLPAAGALGTVRLGTPNTPYANFPDPLTPPSPSR